MAFVEETCVSVRDRMKNEKMKRLTPDMMINIYFRLLVH